MREENRSAQMVISFMKQYLQYRETKAILIWSIVPFPSGREVWKRRPLRGDTTHFEVGERTPSVTRILGIGGAGGDDVLQPLESDDQQQKQESQEAEEYGDIDVDIRQMAWGRVHRRGQRCGKQLQERSVLHTSCKSRWRVSLRHLYEEGRREQVCSKVRPRPCPRFTQGLKVVKLALLVHDSSSRNHRLGY